MYRTSKYGGRFKKLYIPTAIGIQTFWFVFLLYSGYTNLIGEYPEKIPEIKMTEIDEYLDDRRSDIITILDSAVLTMNSELNDNKKDSLINVYRTRMNGIFQNVATYSDEMNIPQEKFDEFHEFISNSEQWQKLRSQN